jgi:hypothetical protein
MGDVKRFLQPESLKKYPHVRICIRGLLLLLVWLGTNHNLGLIPVKNHDVTLFHLSLLKVRS